MMQNLCIVSRSGDEYAKYVFYICQ
jgi:hypothetical protein